MKDLFSDQSAQYAQFRPTYSEELYVYLIRLISAHRTAWDVGTGNGQIATILSNYFQAVYATDISAAQLAYALSKENIHYRKLQAEQTDFPDQFFDLITVGQAIHWFDFEKFYKEVNRTLQPQGLLAVIGYDLPQINEEIDAIVRWVYRDVAGEYWDVERKYVEEAYRTIPFPFREIQDPPIFYAELDWQVDHLLGYIRSWSAMQHYIRANGEAMFRQIKIRLLEQWSQGLIKQVQFPIFLRLGRKFS